MSYFSALQNLTMGRVEKKPKIFSSVSSLPFGIVYGMPSTSYTETDLFFPLIDFHVSVPFRLTLSSQLTFQLSWLV